VLASAALVAFAPTLDLAAAEAFYGTLLELPVTERNPFAVVFDAHGTSLRVTRVQSLSPAPFTVLGWRVDDIAATTAALRARGVTFNRYDSFEQDDDGVWTAPSGTKVAWFDDPAGNNLSLEQNPAAAS
jgi:catechol 2,3-dioxygenase-like lactoylglutathione lyase family enzyme